MNILSPNDIKLSDLEFFTDIITYQSKLIYLNLENVTFSSGFLNDNESFSNLVVCVPFNQFSNILKILDFISKLGLYKYGIKIHFDHLFFYHDNSYFLNISIPLDHDYYNIPVNSIDCLIANSIGNVTIRFDIVKNIINNDFNFRLLMINLNQEILQINKNYQTGKIINSRDW